MNILLIVHRAPFPPDKGDRIRSFHLLERLAQLGSVHLATLSDGAYPADWLSELERRCQKVAVVPMDRRRWLGAAWSFARGRSATEGLFASRQLHRIIQQWTEETSFDAAVVYCSSMEPYLPSRAGMTTLADLVDVDSVKWSQFSTATPFPKSLFYHWEASRVQALERRLCKRVQRIAVTTRPEADLLLAFAPDAPVHAVPNGVDLDYFAPSTTDPEPNSCFFLGAMDYRPNIEGVQWFSREVWPIVRQRVPNAVFRIVGRDPTAAVRRLAELEGVEVVGGVPDVRPWAARSAVGVAPLLVARGVQNKILETMAMARPVIATPGARDGLQTRDGVELRTATSPIEWAEALLSLWQSPHERLRLATAGRDYVETHHRWDHALDCWQDWLTPAVAESTVLSAVP